MVYIMNTNNKTTRRICEIEEMAPQPDHQCFSGHFASTQVSGA